VLVLGVAYKPDIDDMRESPALDVIAALAARKACVSYHDPYVPHIAVDGRSYECQPLTAELLAAADCVVVTTHHSSYDWHWVRATARVVVDTRNALRGTAGEAGARVVRL
jgi:UDP-N-acetyl-D-glucosamine dehydrogenase